MPAAATIPPLIARVPDLPSPSPRRLPRPKARQILPGFRLTLGFTIFYLSAIVLVPLFALVLRAVTPTEDYPTYGSLLGHVWSVVSSERALHSYQVSFGIAFAASLINGVFGLIAAWTLVRYSFPGKRLVDALVDLPFAMPTAVAGLALTQVTSQNGGYIGQWLFELSGWKIAYTGWGILVALTFIGFPFVVRTLQPVIAALGVEVEEAAACLGASRGQTFRRVIFPALWPSLVTGVMLAFGRAVGEYGSVVFISGNAPYLTEITPYLIVVKLESDFDYAGAAALGCVMLLLGFAIVATINGLQAYALRGRVQ